MADRGFFASLFDFSFSSFIATKLVKVLYILAVVLIAFWALAFTATGFARGTGTGLFMLVIIAPLIFLVGVIYTRVILEVLMVVFRIAEDVRGLAAGAPAGAGSPLTGVAAPAQPTPPQRREPDVPPPPGMGDTPG